MNVMTKTRFEAVPLTKHIGAELRGIDLRQKPDDETIRAIYQAWLDHLVIIFPGQKLSQEDLVRVTNYFGTQGMPRRPPKFEQRPIAAIDRVFARSCDLGNGLHRRDGRSLRSLPRSLA